MVLSMVTGKRNLLIAMSFFSLALFYSPAGTVSGAKQSGAVTEHTGEAITKQDATSYNESCKTVLEASKLLISLCTGIFVLVPPFLLRTKNRSMRFKFLFLLGFCFLSVSIFAGVTVILNIAASQRLGLNDIYQPEIWVATLVQLISFALGAVSVGFFLLLNSLGEKIAPQPEFSDVRLRAVLAQAEIYKSKREYDKALSLVDEILRCIKSGMSGPSKMGNE